jgi:cytochrome b subunit of formate dehydrogenase
MLQISKIFFRASLFRYVGIILAASFLILSVNPANAEDANQTREDSTQILQAFNKQHREAEHAKSITEKDKQRIMFLLGVALITLVLITGGLGIAMGLYGKPVFVAHMVFAGLSITLAIVHAIVGLVWFYPF